MGDGTFTAAQAATELLRRRRARESLVAFSNAVTIPGAPMSDDPDEWLFKPIETTMAAHHVLLMDAIQRCIDRDFGRLIVLMPPGSAKSTYTSVVAPAWAMGRRQGYKVILTSYAAKPAERASRRCRAIVGSPEFTSIWPQPVGLQAGSSAVDEWSTTNDATLLAAGILGAITSARADLVIVDDPVAGREEANSETVRKKTREAYQDDLLTRLKPNGSVILIQTRWHPDDLAGGILPENYNGESGDILCRDGQTWEVLCIPAKAERADDPLGRKRGEYLWPEWFPRRHWEQFEANPITWASLFQQRPRPDEGNQFEAAWFEWYDPDDLPEQLNVYGASDYAVTKKTLKTNPDFTEHGIVGVDTKGDLWFTDWWSGQKTTDATLKAGLALAKAHKTEVWFGERGPIENAIGPLRKRLMEDMGHWPYMQLLPTLGDKVARVASFRGLASAGKVHLPRGKQWALDLRDQLCAFTGQDGGRDDKVDVCGLIGRGIDVIRDAKPKREPKDESTNPFTRRGMERTYESRRTQERKSYAR